MGRCFPKATTDFSKLTAHNSFFFLNCSSIKHTVSSLASKSKYICSVNHMVDGILKTSHRDCRMDLPGPTTSVGTRTDYSVGPWDYPACAARHLMAWSTRTTDEKYSVRKLYMSRTVWKTPRRTRLVLYPYSDL
jgi:hypothetical protein